VNHTVNPRNVLFHSKTAESTGLAQPHQPTGGGTQVGNTKHFRQETFAGEKIVIASAYICVSLTLQVLSSHKRQVARCWASPRSQDREGRCPRLQIGTSALAGYCASCAVLYIYPWKALCKRITRRRASLNAQNQSKIATQLILRRYGSYRAFLYVSQWITVVVACSGVHEKFERLSSSLSWTTFLI
jgi:hypothetical protein